MSEPALLYGYQCRLHDGLGSTRPGFEDLKHDESGRTLIIHSFREGRRTDLGCFESGWCMAGGRLAIIGTALRGFSVWLPVHPGPTTKPSPLLDIQAEVLTSGATGGSHNAKLEATRGGQRGCAHLAAG